MVNVKCCVPGCVSSNRRFHYLKFHTLPKDSCRRKTWKLAIKKPRQVSKWSSICRLHFKGGWKKDFYANPSIFPWSQEWPDVVKSYNKYVVEKFIQSQAVDHTYYISLTYYYISLFFKLFFCSNIYNIYTY